MVEQFRYNGIYKRTCPELDLVCDMEAIGTSITPLLMCDCKINDELGFPLTPFLLIEENKEDPDNYFVVESGTESNIQTLKDCQFMQNIEFFGHTISEEEIKNYLKGEDK